jgi:protein O-GlcNAc transferase
MSGFIAPGAAAAFNPQAQFQAANQHLSRGQLLEARRICREALALLPGHPSFSVLLSNIVCQLGDADEGAEALESVTRSVPNNVDLWSALANAANAGARADRLRLFDHHAEYGRAVERSRPGPGTIASDWDGVRPLRVGVVTYDFKERSSVSFFLAPALRHIPPGFEVTAYHTGHEDDAGTQRFRGMVHRFRQLPRASHDELASQIRLDGIDIALELIGHTGVRRLPAFQPRCAPLQVSYLGYSNTSGLRSIDWRIVDSQTDPEGAEKYATERLWRLDPCFVCFEPDPEAPRPAAAPCLATGRVTFGAFSDLFKLNDATLAAWARVHRAVPDSGMLLKNIARTIPDGEQFLRSRLERAGFDMARVEIRKRTATYPEHLAMYADVDIALDTFPYNGTTTVCDALMMGVPMIGMRPKPEHDRHAARVILSILNAARLHELIVDNEDHLVRRCAELAADHKELCSLRPRVRQQFLASAVCDAASFAERFWKALRAMWDERAHAAPAGR